jgi:hypothetical protein
MASAVAVRLLYTNMPRSHDVDDHFGTHMSGKLGRVLRIM